MCPSGSFSIQRLAALRAAPEGHKQAASVAVACVGQMRLHGVAATAQGLPDRHDLGRILSGPVGAAFNEEPLPRIRDFHEAAWLDLEVIGVATLVHAPPHGSVALGTTR